MIEIRDIVSKIVERGWWIYENGVYVRNPNYSKTYVISPLDTDFRISSHRLAILMESGIKPEIEHEGRVIELRYLRLLLNEVNIGELSIQSREFYEELEKNLQDIRSYRFDN